MIGNLFCQFPILPSEMQLLRGATDAVTLKRCVGSDQWSPAYE